jgi:hypothetical protein
MRNLSYVLAAGALAIAGWIGWSDNTALAQQSSAAPSAAADAAYPKPALVPTSWELDFTHGRPQRIVVEVPGMANPQAYWYLTYTVVNRSDREQSFLPAFEMLTPNGTIVRSDRSIPGIVFDKIKEREKKTFLEPFYKTAGTLLVGEEQAKDGVAIWPETQLRMGYFSIFIEGLSGETAEVKAGDKTVILRKTLQLNYHIRGDEVRPGEDEVNAAETAVQWVMR